MSLKSIPSGNLLRNFVALNNQVLDRFTADERRKIGVHVCPGGDHDSTHSADVDYSGLLPDLFQLKAGRFYLQMASESDKHRLYPMIKQLANAKQLVFIGVVDPIHPTVETAAQVRDRILEAASFLPIEQLGTTDDCGFAPFADDTSTARKQPSKRFRPEWKERTLPAGSWVAENSCPIGNNIQPGSIPPWRCESSQPSSTSTPTAAPPWDRHGWPSTPAPAPPQAPSATAAPKPHRG